MRARDDDMLYAVAPTPLGDLWLGKRAGESGLVGAWYRDQAGAPDLRAARVVAERFAEELAQLGEYFAGQRRSFSLELAPRGTPFQRRVWAALAAIPFVTTRSYGELAQEIGAPKAARAVGAAAGRNPCLVVVPCHRLVGANGALTGFAAGEARKRWLLALEGREA